MGATKGPYQELPDSLEAKLTPNEGHDGVPTQEQGGTSAQDWDVEAQQNFSPLTPGMDQTEAMLRWGYIRKVYGIITVQLLLTTIVAAMIINSMKVQEFALSPPVQITCLFSPFVFLLLLACNKDKYPLNYGLLVGFTLGMSVSVGAVCSLYPSLIVLQALAITTAIVLSLTAYTFYAVRKGQDFSFLGPFLFAALMALIVWSIIQIFLPMGPVANSLLSLLGAVLFAGFLVYDTDRMIKSDSLDNYIWSSVSIYLDVINMFLYILSLLNRGR